MTEVEKFLPVSPISMIIHRKMILTMMKSDSCRKKELLKPLTISQWRTSDLLIDGIIDYEQYPFENFSVFEQLRQLEHNAISSEDFVKQADFDIFDVEEKVWLKK